MHAFPSAMGAAEDHAATQIRGAAALLAGCFPGLSLEQRLREARSLVPGRLVLTTSFGLEDQALTHALASEELDIDLVTLDTGRLFPETYAVWAETERRYGLRVRAFAPERRDVERLVAEDGIDGFRNAVEARQRCCGVRKVEPLARALAGAAGWITGLRADQSAHRAAATFAEADAVRRLVKINPLSDFSRDAVREYVRVNEVPYNPLHDVGFLSIGCAPCTRAVRPGEPERAGRWWWEQEEKKECGLHLRPVPAAQQQGARDAA
jgi:phosphoadenosine phosphosulfate reductase